MEDSGADAAIRKNLLDRLLNSVKQVQVYFGGRQEIATESDLRVSALCTEWEAALLHGYKKSKGTRRLGKSDTPPSLWPLAKLCLSVDEIQRFIQLSHVTTDVGRGRAWLRSAINERTLENYLHTIFADESQLRTYYDPHAFVLDPECSSMLPNMAAGLGSIIFAIPTNETYLNTSSRSVDVPLPAVTPPIAPHSASSFPIPLSSLTATSPAAIFDPTVRSRVTAADEEDDEVVAVSTTKEKKKKRKKKSPYVSPRSTSPLIPKHPTPEPVSNHHLDEEEKQEVGGANRLDVGGVASNMLDCHSSSSSRLSLNSTNEEGPSPTFVALDTSRDDMSDAQAAMDSMAVLLSATDSHLGMAGGGVTPPPPDNAGGGMSTDELREAMLALVKTKDNLEERNRTLEDQVSELTSSRTELLTELEQCRSDLKAAQESHTNRLQALERENDLLSDQLQKYVGMVQAHRRESSAKSTESAVLGATASAAASDSATTVAAAGNVQGGGGGGGGDEDLQSQLQQVEQRLAEMAEMYGDVMELNKRLHQDIITKDKIIETMTSRLRQAGLEASPSGSPRQRASSISEQRKIDVWIPSAIKKKGKGPESYHVYQIFIRVKTEEWNVYRRYAEFREFHQQIQSYLPDAGSFSFPPKKTVGRRSNVVVEERRQKLQEYLRFIFNLCCSQALVSTKSKVKEKNVSKQQQLEPIFPIGITKSKLIELFPFFKEDSSPEVNSHPPPTRTYSGL